MAGTPIFVRPFTNFAQSLASLFQPPANTIRGIDTRDWQGPLQPVKPIAPQGTEPRRYQYYSGQNLNYTPRGDELLSADQLRQAATYPLARVLIENVKDVVCAEPVNIRLRRYPGESPKEYAKRKPDYAMMRDIGDIIERPNPEQNRQEFLRQILEDLLVIDAASILFRTNAKGKLSELRAIDGSTITRYIDTQGYTPMPPSPAYAQVYYGIPMVDLTTKQLLYAPRNVLPGRLYGTSPTQQAIQWIQIGAQRLDFKLANYTAGSIPDAIQVVPRGVSPEQIQEGQEWLTSDLAGNLAKRRQIRLVQGYTEKGDDKIIFPKESLLADSYDELEVNCFCFAYGVSRQRLAKMMNRAQCFSSDTETLTENGWKSYDQIHQDEKIATVNPKTNSIEYHIPTERYVSEYRGKMVAFKTKNVDILVTPDHRMWGRHGDINNKTSGSRYHKFYAKDSYPQVRFKAATKFDGPEKEFFHVPSVDKFHANDHDGCKVRMDDWLEFLGYYLSEGGLSHVKGHYLLTLGQSKDVNADKAAKIQACLERLPFSYKPYPNQNDGMYRWNVYGKPLCSYLMAEVGGYRFDKRIPRQFLNISQRQLRILFDAMMLGDGSAKFKDGRMLGQYTSVSKRLADDFLELTMKVGYCTSLLPRTDRRTDHKRRPSWLVNICEREEHLLVKNKSNRGPIRQVDYDGIVYCFNVPNHLFITRRNGKISIQGNSESDQAASEKEGLKPWFDWTENSIWNRIVQDYLGFVDYEVVYEAQGEIDALKRAQVQELQQKSGQKSINEIRDDNGDELRSEPEADELFVITPTGPIPLSQSAHVARAGALATATAPPPSPVNPGQPASKSVVMEEVRKIRERVATLQHHFKSSNGNGRH